MQIMVECCRPTAPFSARTIDWNRFARPGTRPGTRGPRRSPGSKMVQTKRYAGLTAANTKKVAMAAPMFSIIIPTLNVAAVLPACLDSRPSDLR